MTKFAPMTEDYEVISVSLFKLQKSSLVGIQKLGFESLGKRRVSCGMQKFGFLRALKVSFEFRNGNKSVLASR